MATVMAWVSPTQSNRTTHDGPTRSNQTVRQIPVVRGYQIECGSSSQSCFPRGISSSDGSSMTSTSITARPSSSASVMSHENAV